MRRLLLPRLHPAVDPTAEDQDLVDNDMRQCAAPDDLKQTLESVTSGLHPVISRTLTLRSITRGLAKRRVCPVVEHNGQACWDRVSS